MSDIKVGTKVTTLSHTTFFNAGDRGVVIEVDESLVPYKVEKVDGSGYDWFSASEIRVYGEETPKQEFPFEPTEAKSVVVPEKTEERKNMEARAAKVERAAKARSYIGTRQVQVHNVMRDRRLIEMYLTKTPMDEIVKKGGYTSVSAVSQRLVKLRKAGVKLPIRRGVFGAATIRPEYTAELNAYVEGLLRG